MDSISGLGANSAIMQQFLAAMNQDDANAEQAQAQINAQINQDNAI